MRTSIMAALMAATALIPGVATAQRGDRDGNAGWQQRGERPAGRERIGQRPEQPRPQAQPQAPQPQAQPQQQQQQQPRFRPQRPDGGNGGPRFDRGDRGGNGGPRVDRGNDRPLFDRGGQGGYRPTPQASAPVAQPNRGNDNRGGNNQWRGNDNRGGNNQWRGDDNRGGNNQWRGNDNRGGNNQWRGNDNRGGNNQWRGNDNRGGNWNRNWRQDNRYDWNRRRQYNRNAYHLPRYYAPSGWRYGYRRFDIGFTLSSVLFNQNYWINDADYYGLPEAYGEYRWVRYYNDALLVDTYSGEVVDTVYDIFW